jgi:hypothetical protein
MIPIAFNAVNLTPTTSNPSPSRPPSLKIISSSPNAAQNHLQLIKRRSKSSPARQTLPEVSLLLSALLKTFSACRTSFETHRN